jgi:hypothetical protein
MYFTIIKLLTMSDSLQDIFPDFFISLIKEINTTATIQNYKAGTIIMRTDNTLININPITKRHK